MSDTRNLIRRLLLLSTAAVPAMAAAAPCDLTAFRAGAITAAATDNGVALNWAGSGGQPMVLRLAVQQGAPVIQELSVGGKTVARNAGIEFDITTGTRRMSNQQMQPLKELGVEISQAEIDEHKWDAFWDAPLDMRPPPAPGAAGLGGNPPPRDGVASQPGLPRKPAEVSNARLTYRINRCAVSSEGGRAAVRFARATAGVFSGDVLITVYQGTSLLRVEYDASTSERSVAYKYNAGITGLDAGTGAGVTWRDTSNMVQRYGLSGKKNEGAVPLFAANRLVVGETGGGAIAAFTPPHTFFWAREIERNVGNNWYRNDGDNRFSIGIRQADKEVVEEYMANWALYSAPPGTIQRMAMYLFPTADGAKAAFDGALQFTNGDRYKPLAGYKVMANHFHTSLGEHLLREGSLDARMPDFDVMRSAGVNIMGITDRPRDSRDGKGPTRLDVMKAYFDGAQRFSDDDFMIMPNFEASAILGGHWDVLVSKPTYWVEKRAASQPLSSNVQGIGRVYNVGNAADVMSMVEQENMLIYMPHPRTKGSTHYPDAVAKDMPFNSDRYRGAGWRWGMGSDLSEVRLSEKRVLPLFDEMNNWMAASAKRPKYLMAITETYEKAPGDDIYAMGPVNYIKLDRLPKGGDYGPIIKAMNDGDYFVTSGEVLITDGNLTGSGRTAAYTANVTWTFPLDFVEIVWGDGKTTERKLVDARQYPAFGSQTFSVPFDASKAKWVRFAAWDSAGNGAMEQPLPLNRPGRRR